MNKWQGLSIIIIIISFCIILAVFTISDNNADIELAKAGLEQCPIKVGSVRAIWVKDCTKYLKESR